MRRYPSILITLLLLIIGPAHAGEKKKPEEEANRFAADTLIPPDALSKFLKVGIFTNEAIHAFADTLEIGPGIIIGRLQREGILARHQGNRLKRIFNWAIRDQ